MDARTIATSSAVLNKQSISPSNGNVFLNPNRFGLRIKRNKKGEIVDVKVKIPAREKYTARSRLIFSLSRYLKAKYSPNNAAEPIKGNL